MTKTEINITTTKERPPKFVENRRSRNACFHKRKDAFLKKAFHLSVNTDSEIVVLVRRRRDSEKPPLIFASHGNVDSVYTWFKGQQANDGGATVHTNSSVYEQYWLSTPQSGTENASNSSSSSSSVENSDPDLLTPKLEPFWSSISLGEEPAVKASPEPPLLLPMPPQFVSPPTFAIHELRE